MYDDWIDLVVDFLAYERSRDDRPIVLYGLSAGGMVTYYVAARAPRDTPAGIVGRTFLDQREQVVRDETDHDKLSSRVGGPLMGLLPRTPAAGLEFVREKLDWIRSVRWWLMGETGRSREGIAEIEPVRAQEPDQWDQSLAWLLERDGRVDEAVEVLRTSMELGSARELALLLIRQGRAAVAVADFPTVAAQREAMARWWRRNR
ncbi:hypothetical protein ACIRYZ_24545 [Kitasatospora sp. NPDC101155]|uniref:hypothetical protein n=1 Tax=Kitasatospora sp. NPDC101155 TaxID=3364097 RepID=UPI003803A7E1